VSEGGCRADCLPCTSTDHCTACPENASHPDRDGDRENNEAKLPQGAEVPRAAALLTEEAANDHGSGARRNKGADDRVRRSKNHGVIGSIPPTHDAQSVANAVRLGELGSFVLKSWRERPRTVDDLLNPPPRRHQSRSLSRSR
jgi:hypothetical protein